MALDPSLWYPPRPLASYLHTHTLRRTAFDQPKQGTQKAWHWTPVVRHGHLLASIIPPPPPGVIRIQQESRKWDRTGTQLPIATNHQPPTANRQLPPTANNCSIPFLWCFVLLTS